MASGVTVAPAVLDVFQNIKLAKKDDERIRFVKFGFCHDQIDVEKIVLQKDLNGENAFSYFKREFLQEKKCCYVLYDCHYETRECPKQDLVFVMWCPDDGCCKDRLNYASSKDALKKKLDGVKHNLDMHDHSDCSDMNYFASKLATNVITLEGNAVVPNDQ